MHLFPRKGHLLAAVEELGSASRLSDPKPCLTLPASALVQPYTKATAFPLCLN